MLNSGWNSKIFNSSVGTDLLYQIYIPEGYSPDKKYACILYMHSAGVKCDDNSHIYTPEAEFLRVFENSKYKNNAIVIAPCCPKASSWVISREKKLKFDFLSSAPTDHMTATLELLDFYISDLSIDKNRIYTYGMSMGAHAVWDLLARNPGVFAAAVPAAGAGDPSTVHLMDKTALWIFHGKLDDIVPAECAYIMKKALEEYGRHDIKYTEFESLHHGIWSSVAHTEGLLDWMFSKSL